jgi:ribA/ribD-fused uncharacterized protein
MPPKKDSTPSDDQASPAKEEAPLFFYMPDTKWGEFCQWYPCTFTVTKGDIAALLGTQGSFAGSSEAEEGLTFNCAEQFMMYCKAGRFRDADSQARILAATSPKEQKALGKAVGGFRDEAWDPVKSDVVAAGNIAKFGQNRHLQNVLLGTGDRLLVEAASRDRVWGIGYAEKHAMRFRKHWGENRLGRALMEAREHLRKERKRSERPWLSIEEEPTANP